MIFARKLCSLESSPVLHELGNVGVDDAVPLLDGIASRQQVLGVVVSDLCEGAVFALLGGPIGHDGHRDLDVRVAHLGASQDEVAFKLADTPDADAVSPCAGIGEDDVLEHRPVVDSVVGVEGEVEAQVRQVVLLLAPQRFPRLQVEAGALADDLRVLEDPEVPRERLALDFHALLALEVRSDVRKRRGGAEVVDNVVAHLVEHGDVLYLHASADVLFEDLLDDRRDVCALVGESGVVHRFREAAFEDVCVELCDRVRIHGQPQESFHLAVLAEVQRLHLEFDVAPGNLSGQLAGKQVGVRAGDEDGEATFGAELVEYIFEALDVLYLVDEKVLRPRNAEQGLDEGLELLWGLHGSVSVSVEVEIRDMVVIDAFGPELFGDALHEAGLSAAADPGDHLDHPVVMVEAADLFQIVFSGKQAHTDSNLHWSQYIKSYIYRGISY